MTDYTELVKALRCCIQNPPETCVGCTYNMGNNECNVKMMIVDAADAIEALQAYCEQLKTENTMLYNTITADKGVMFERIQSLAQQLPKRGKWITKYDGFEFDVRCSICGEEALFKEGGSYDHKYSNYCPNCGAKMMEVQDGE